MFFFFWSNAPRSNHNDSLSSFFSFLFLRERLISLERYNEEQGYIIGWVTLKGGEGTKERERERFPELFRSINEHYQS